MAITPCGTNADWDGPTTANGLWGETYEDRNGNDRYDLGEPFVDDPANGAIDPQSNGKYDGVFMAGFGRNRMALGCRDDIWVRALVIDDGQSRVAFVSVDVIGMLKHGSYAGFARAEAMLEPDLGITHFVYSSTHNHEGPDTMGLWGTDLLSDGKFPRYMRFIDRQTARALRDAVAALEPVETVRPSQVNPDQDPELRGLQVRTGCRPPFVFDTDLRAIAFERADGSAIATLLNWGTHPESLEDRNFYISSDFPHYIRDEVESRLGGTAVYFSADLGAAEIVGDTCVGGAGPRRPDGTNEFDNRDDLGFARTERIGRVVGAAAVRAVRAAPAVDVRRLDVRTTAYRASGSNETFELGRSLGILDLDPAVYDPGLCPGAAGLCGPIEQSAIGLLDRDGTTQVQIVTFPGEVFPELYLGVAEHRRDDCPEADTGRPAEPSVRAAIDAPFQVVIGLSPDELGYIVPGYDFHAGAVLEEAPDPCQERQFDPAVPRRRVPAHYHETLSLGPEAGSYVTCKLVELLRGPGAVASEAACAALP